MNYRIIYPKEFIENELDFYYKGYLLDLQVVVDNKSFSLNIYSIERLNQELWDRFEFGEICFFEKNMIIVQDISSESISESIKHLFNTQKFGEMYFDEIT